MDEIKFTFIMSFTLSDVTMFSTSTGGGQQDQTCRDGGGGLQTRPTELWRELCKGITRNIPVQMHILHKLHQIN